MAYVQKSVLFTSCQLYDYFLGTLFAFHYSSWIQLFITWLFRANSTFCLDFVWLSFIRPYDFILKKGMTFFWLHTDFFLDFWNKKFQHNLLNELLRFEPKTFRLWSQCFNLCAASHFLLTISHLEDLYKTVLNKIT